MTRLLTTILLLFALPSFGQNKHCFCDKDNLMNSATVSCDTTTFSNNTKLYWQYTCDNIWLTFENLKIEKVVIDQVPISYFNLTYILGYHLIKEFNNSLLFRSGCAANGPCIYTLIDKNNGSKIKEFDQLICIDTDVKRENAHKYNFDFVVYLSDTSEHLIIYFLDSKRTLRVPFKEELTAIIPQQQFDEMILENNNLTLFYELDNNTTKKTLKVDLNDKKYSR